MSLSFPRKYRASTISEYVGNKRLVSSVWSFLNSETRPQVILLEGASGGGKTTMGRLIGKEYQCSNRDPEKGACGECEYCKAYEEYITSGDTGGMRYLTEVDIADNSRKDDLSSVLEDAYMPSIDSTWKVYLFDEVHKASQALQNRLLKICEEPPEKVLFIFCTTEPDKLLGTLLNRMQYRLEVVKPSVSELVERLEFVCRKENAKYDLKGLRLISAKADLTIRQALGYLEQVLTEGGSATYKNVCDILGVVEANTYFKFLNLLFSDAPTRGIDLTLFLSSIKTGSGFRSFAEGFSNFVVRGIYLYHGVKIEGADAQELKTYKELFDTYSVGDVVSVLKYIKTLDLKDMEAGLFVLAFAPRDLANTSDLSVTSFEGASAEVEHSLSITNRIESTNLTESEKTTIIGNQMEKVSVDDILKIF